MTTATTHGEIRSRINGYRPLIDSPPVRARARASVEVTKRDRKISDGLVAKAGAVRADVVRGARRWWVWTGRPASLATSWRLSAVDEARIPLKWTPFNIAWQISNWTDRLFMFALILAAPTVFQGPLRWIATRPTRRLGFYLLALAAAAAFIFIGSSTDTAGKE